MGYLFKSCIGAALIALLFQPVSALLTNVSVGGTTTLITNSFLHDPNYMPVEYVYALIVIGLVSLAVSRIFEQAEDLFAIGAILPLALSAWFSNFMTIERNGFISSATGTSVINTQIIAANPYLSIVMIVFTLLAVMNVLWVFFLKGADKKTGD